MKEKKNIILVVVVIAILLLGGIWLVNSGDSKSNKKTHQVKQLELFTKAYEDSIASIDPSSYASVDEYQSVLNKKLDEVYKGYAGTDSVDSFMLGAKNLINGSSSIPDLSSSLSSLLDIDLGGFVDKIFNSSSSNVDKRTLTLSSTTVCESVADAKYCLNGDTGSLSANVYITDKSSSKWAVLLHGVLMSGSLMYNSLGGMYEAKGYNILAIDSRGHGNSDGSVAMGYLESLDVYDWIKDLNSNYARYGVDVAPNSIIVHGVSLGGATTLQLATNPDIAKVKGGAYSKNLEQLNVKGFVDDCGYTSMSGIITGMLSMGDVSSLSSLLSSFNINDLDFTSELKNLLGDFKITGFENIGSSFNGIMDFSSKWNDLYDAITNAGSSSNVTPNVDSVLDKYLGGADFNNILNKYKDYFNNSSLIPNIGGNNTNSNSGNNNSSGTNNWGSSNWGTNNWYNKDWNNKDWRNGNWGNFFNGSMFGTNSVGNSKVMLVNNSLTNGSGNFLDGIVGTVLMKLVGVGLTEDNYDYYSDAFAGDRKFPDSSKVLVIHGTADTTVPYKNADTVAAKAGNKLFYQWKASGKPHAFIVVGSDKEKYSNLISEYVDCINGGSCNATQLG